MILYHVCTLEQFIIIVLHFLKLSISFSQNYVFDYAYFFWNIRINDELKYPQAKKESINFGRFERIFFKKTKLQADYLILFNWCCNATGNFSLISYYCNQISTFVLMMGSIERNVPKTLGNYDVIYMCVVGN